MMCGPRADTHARESWAVVIPFFWAMEERASTIFWLCAMAWQVRQNGQGCCQGGAWGTDEGNGSHSNVLHLGIERKEFAYRLRANPPSSAGPLGSRVQEGCEYGKTGIVSSGLKKWFATSVTTTYEYATTAILSSAAVAITFFVSSSYDQGEISISTAAISAT